jgi:hypothetical protein
VGDTQCDMDHARLGLLHNNNNNRDSIVVTPTGQMSAMGPVSFPNGTHGLNILWKDQPFIIIRLGSRSTKGKNQILADTRGRDKPNVGHRTVSSCEMELVRYIRR